MFLRNFTTEIMSCVMGSRDSIVGERPLQGCRRRFWWWKDFGALRINLRIYLPVHAVDLQTKGPGAERVLLDTCEQL